jgi:hydrogenase expression/formation protein HypC
MGKVDFGGVIRRVCLDCVPEIEVGEYTLVHVGFAISRINEAEARQVFEFLEAMHELNELRETGEPEPTSEPRLETRGP